MGKCVIRFPQKHLDSDHGVQAYEVEFYAGNLEYDYDIDAATGQIRSKDTDIEDDFQTVSPTGASLTEADTIARVLEKVPDARNQIGNAAMMRRFAAIPNKER